MRPEFGLAIRSLPHRRRFDYFAMAYSKFPNSRIDPVSDHLPV